MAKKVSTKSSKSSKSVKKQVLFVKKRGSYVPVSDIAWFMYLPFVMYLGFSWFIGLNHTSDYGLAILWILPNWVAAAVIMTWIAKKTS